MYCKNVSKYRINTCISLFKMFELFFVLEIGANEEGC